MHFNSYSEARSAWAADAAVLAQRGIVFPGAQSYMVQDWESDVDLFAQDAQPALVTTPNSATPALFTTMVDPTALEILLQPNKGAEILGEVRKGSWTDLTALFPVVEHTGEVTSYGDYEEGGRAGLNAEWPQRQSYLFQVIKEYGDREVDLAGRALIAWVAGIDRSATILLDKFMNLTYHFGVSGLQNYGILNDPALPAFVSPGIKAAGNGNVWVYNGVINATPNEVFIDIQTLYYNLVAQSNAVVDGLIDMAMPLKLVVPPQTSIALTSANSFGVDVRKLLKEAFPSLSIVTDGLYGVYSSANPQGLKVGNTVQMIAPNAGGQDTGFCAFNEKARAHPVVRQLSSWKQKMTAGTWGTVIRQPFAVATMVGV